MARKTPRCTCPPDSRLVFLGHLPSCPELAVTANAAPPQHLTVDDVLNRGLTRRRLDHWCRQGWLQPRHHGGTGYTRAWPQVELHIADLMRRLTDAGLDVEKAAGIARTYYQVDGVPLVTLGPGLVLAIDTDLLTETGEGCG